MLEAGVAAVLDLLDPEIEWRAAQDSQSHRGHAGVERSVNSWFEVWDDYEAEIEELIDAGDDVLVVISSRARGKGSGVTVTHRYYRVCTVREGKIVRMLEYSKRSEALKALGRAP
jgi:ketosteroid isomerase-like protein